MRCFKYAVFTLAIVAMYLLTVFVIGLLWRGVSLDMEQRDLRKPLLILG